MFTDDAAARRHAQRLGIPLGGTLGVMRRLTDLQVLTLEEANQLLARMIDGVGFRSPIVDLRDLQ